MGEPYYVGIDLGTSRIGAATSRLASDGSISVAPFALGRKSASVPTVAFVTEEGDILLGDAAERRGVTQPERLISEFKRDIGDDVPFVVGGQAIRAEQLFAVTIADVVAAVAEREGAAPAGVVLTHPASWGPHRIGLIHAALRDVDLGNVSFMTEPEAAARHYDASRELAPGANVAVYDLGGGTFDCVILRKTDWAFETLGEPVGLSDIGGADFDDAVMRHVLSSMEVAPEALDGESTDALVALSQLRRDCIDAKESLSFDSGVTIPVFLTANRSSVRLTRAEFESMIDPLVERTIDSLEDALEGAGLEPSELDSVLLIGGSSRIPLVTQRISERLETPTAIDADPKSSIALGAARTALVRDADARMSAGVALVPMSGAAGALVPVAESAGELELVSTAPALAAPVGAVAGPQRPSARHLIAISGGAVVIAVAIVFGTSLSAGVSGGSDRYRPIDEAAAVETTPTPSAPAPAAAAPADAGAAPASEAGGGDQGFSSPRQSSRNSGNSNSGNTNPTTRSNTNADTGGRPTPSNPAPSGGGNNGGGNPNPGGGGNTPTNPPAEPSDPTDPPVDPTDPPVDPTDPPVDPTDPPVDPTDPPVDPTDPPVDPTDPPVDPTDPPVDPTDPPVDPNPTPEPTFSETPAPESTPAV